MIQSNGPDRRFIAVFQDEPAIKTFLSSFIDGSGEELELKITDLDDPENPLDFVGLVKKKTLKTALNNYENVIFHNGYHDLMIARTETEDTVVFDEHGMIFIYTKDNYSDTLEKFGLAYKTNEKLIDEFSHWHYRPANGREDLKSLITELGLRKLSV